MEWGGRERFASYIYLESAFSGLYCKHVMIVNYASGSVNKLRASLNDDARVVIYDRHMWPYIVQATAFCVV